ncbi:hypothetical protein NPIL_412651, partial [Nephila pilipes]
IKPLNHHEETLILIGSIKLGGYAEEEHQVVTLRNNEPLTANAFQQ